MRLSRKLLVHELGSDRHRSAELVDRLHDKNRIRRYRRRNLPLRLSLETILFRPKWLGHSVRRPFQSQRLYFQFSHMHHSPLTYLDDADELGRRTVCCPACGYQRRTKWPAQKVHHACPQARRHDDCQNRLEEARAVECPTCTGKVRIKVFTCALHTECTLAKPLPGIACCQGCRDYEPLPPRAPGPGA